MKHTSSSLLAFAGIIFVASLTSAQNEEPVANAVFYEKIDVAMGPHLSPWDVLSMQGTELTVSTQPIQLASGLYRSYVLLGRVIEDGEPIFNEPELLARVRYFYHWSAGNSDHARATQEVVSFSDYFDVTHPIEEGTLAELAAFLLSSSVLKALASECGDCGNLFLRRVRVEDFSSFSDIRYLAEFANRSGSTGVVAAVHRNHGGYVLSDVNRIHR